MKASVASRYGSPDVLEFIEVEKPKPKVNEVLVKIFATTVNRTDTTCLRASPFFARIVTGLLKPKKSILGTEFAGKIEAIGENVTSFNVGDQVFGFNEDLFGSHAQYMTIAENKSLVKMPQNITYEQAAASSEGAHYAYNMINKIKLEKDQKVLVNGATGGIGSAAVQLLKYFGAHVTGTCRTEHINLVKSIGADRVIDYTKEDFTKEDQNYNFIFDTVGKSSFNKCKSLLLPKGVYISSDLGYMAQNIFYALITPLIGNKKVVFPIPLDCKGSILLIKDLLEKGKFKTVIDKRFPLEQVAEAYRYVELAQKVGNVIINVNHDKIT